MGIQSTIEAKAASLPPSMRRVALTIRANPALVLDNTISELAAACQTSVASVIRFCRAVGLSGYAQLRMELATELGREATRYGEANVLRADIARSDTLSEIARKIASLEMLAIEETLSGIDLAIVERVIAAMDGAQRILLFGMGASSQVAGDLQQKLFRIGRSAFAPTDPHEALTAAALAGGTTLAIGFSHSGATLETVRFLEISRRSGARTVAMTSNAGSKIADVAHEVLLTRAREASLRAGAMVSRIAQLALVDCLFLGLARLHYDDVIVALEQTRAALEPAG